mmetsp:Transcript_75741/g.192200  ORF Transcript_75741/g.192200 Transcript_75741/m.192200 type:complete len:240 (-) Transcript_75741:310-1029(-)
MSEEYRLRSRNAMLVKDDVGKAKPTVYDLPPEGHAFGRCDPPDQEGAREVTMHWAAHVPRSKPGVQCQDFRKLHRLAAKSGVTNAGELAAWRTTNEVKLVTNGPAGSMPKVIPSDVIPSFAYGKKSRPSTPIGSVVGNHYGTEQEEMLSLHYKKHAESMPNGKRVIKLTLASKKQIENARSARQLIDNPPPPKEPFIMAKFKNVKGRMSARVGTFTSAKLGVCSKLVIVLAWLSHKGQA